jgi:transcriptional regulator with XRE-family HTH domain
MMPVIGEILKKRRLDMIDTLPLGDRLRRLRRERNLSQRDLAQQAGISVNSISLIERDEISPSVATLQSLATAMKIKVSYFFDEESTGRVLHVKAVERPVLNTGGVRIEGIGQHLKTQELEPFRITLDPQAVSGERQVVHPGVELVCCQIGRLEYWIDGQIYRLEKGDFLVFEATLPHTWGNPFDQVAEFLLVLQTPNDSLDSVQRHFADYPSVMHIEK